MHEVIQKAKEMGLRGVVFDLDGTAYEDSFAKSIGHGILKREAGNAHAGNVLNGLYGALKIKLQALNWNGYEERNAKGIETLFEALGKTRRTDRNYAYHLARQHMANNEIDGFGNFLKDCRNELGHVFIATDECDIAPDVVAERHYIDGWAANPVTYRINSMEVSSEPIVFRKNGKWEGRLVCTTNPIISGCRIESRNPRDKKTQIQKLLGKVGLDISKILAVGDSRHDIPYLAEAGFSASSPQAKKEVRKKTLYQIKSYLD